MSKYTPGPWHLDRKLDDQGDMACLAETARHTIWGVYEPEKAELDNATAYALDKANAQLIAAAPELLEIALAYRNLLRTSAQTDGQIATFHHIESVINKATGDTK